jgi:hypothetical protein
VEHHASSDFFGEQLHTKVLHDELSELGPEQVAAYVAKHSCKGSLERITRRGAAPEQLREIGLPEQLVQMAIAATRLAERPGLQPIGSGYLNPGDVLLAAGVEASIRVAREALLDLRCGPPDDARPW